MLADDPVGGEPIAVVSTNLGPEVPARTSEDAGAKPEAPAATANKAGPNRYDGPSTASPQTAPAGSRTITIIDGSSGKRQDVVVPNSDDGKPAAPGDRLSEPSRHGPLPKIAHDGLRPADAFAHPMKAGSPNAPRIAIVAGGLGIGGSGTGDGSRSCPGRSRWRSCPTAATSSGRRRSPAPASTSCCCRYRWSRLTIPTTIPARKRCSPHSTPARTSIGCTG